MLYSAMQSLQRLHSGGVLEKIIPIQKLHTTEEILRQKQAVYEISSWLGNTPLARHAGAASIVKLKVGLYC